MTGGEAKVPYTADGAAGTGSSFPPVPGEDGKVVMLFRSQGESGPKLRGDGTADFREMDAVVEVKAGTPLARLQPPGLGSPGRDARGIAIPAAPGKPAQLIAGPGTKISADGQTLLADCDGAVAVRKGIICVSALLELGRGVDFHTGNIRFDGEVRVKGNVAEGFRIEAGGNIRVEGDAEGATLVSLRGNVQVTGGFFGQGKGSIQAKGEVRIASARQAEIRCGNLVVEQSMQDCQATIHGISAAKPECRVFGGKITCFGSARLAHVGADGSRTELVLRDEEEEALRAEKARLEALENAEKDLAAELDRKLRTFKAWITKAGNAVIPPKTAAEMKAAAEAFTQSRRKLANYNSERAMVDKQLAAFGDRKQSFSAAGSIEGNVHLDLLHFRRLLDSHDGGKEFIISKEKGLIDRTAPAPGQPA